MCKRICRRLRPAPSGPVERQSARKETARWRLGGPGHDDHVAESEDFTQPVRNGAPAVIACQVPSADLTALQSIMDCDLVVLVARSGTPRAALRELLDSLTEFGVSPKWAIFLGTSSTGLPGGAETR